MRLLVIIALLVPTAVFGGIPNRLRQPMTMAVDEAEDDMQAFAIPAGSCGVNKYNQFRAFEEILEPFQPYIVGGTTATANFYPWQASLQYGTGSSKSHTCGGSIYNQQYILTAAHCFTGMSSASNWQVVLGKHSLSSSEKTAVTYQVASIIKHSSYNMFTNANDIALMKLSTKITYTDEIQPVCMPAKTIGTLDGSTTTVTGWGATKEGGSAANTLQQVNVPVISNTKCQQKYASEKITDGMICAGYDAGGKDSCQGDSGGPQVLKVNNKWTQVGVVSWGYGCARANNPGVYTRVSEYLDWLTANAK